ncbi:hypothetical protein [Mycobacterium lentiflavum]|uniref:hypothetical protein n=1 Tax=Mycobacterium lentiflavum TaxID=141349 RepID=UPI00111224CE|nr:hypothetical protein [Mycobacterium lentiflavum]
MSQTLSRRIRHKVCHFSRLSPVWYENGVNAHSEKLIEELRRASIRTPEQEARDAEAHARIKVLISSGEISADELARGVLRAVLKVHGHSTNVPGLGQLVRLPTWQDGLFTNADVSNFYCLNGFVDRTLYNELAKDAGIVHCSKLLRDLTAAGQLDLADPSMTGIVAQAWALGEPGSASCIGYSEWLKLFRLNGFTYLGQPAQRPNEPVTVYRGCRHEHRHGMSWSTEVGVAHRFATEGMSSRTLVTVYAARVEPDYLLAFIEEGNEEYEWVIDPTGLSDDNVSRIDNRHE